MKSWYGFEQLNEKTEASDTRRIFLKMAGEETADLKAFFDRLSLLKDVPLLYLVCHEDFLKEESLNFFYVDPKWVQWLLCGACLNNGMKRELIQETWVGQKKIMSGFLLCSRLVQMFGGLEIHCYYGEKELPLRAIERKNERILLCIAEGQIDRVTFVQPQEGMFMEVTEDIPFRENGGAGVLDIEKNGYLSGAELADRLITRRMHYTVYVEEGKAYGET